MTDEQEYEFGSIKAPLHAPWEFLLTIWDWTEFVIDVGDAAVIQRHQFRHIKDFRVDKSVPKSKLQDIRKRWFLIYADQQAEAKYLRAMYNEGDGRGHIPSTLIMSALMNKDDAFKRFVKAVTDQIKQKAAADKKGEPFEWTYVEPPKPKGDALRAHPEWRRSLNFRHNLDVMQNSIERTANNPAYVQFNIPNLGTVRYRTDRDLPENAKLTEVTISVEDGKWWVSIKYKVLKEEAKNLHVTHPDDVPDFTGLTNKQIVDLLDTSEVRAGGGDQGVTNRMVLSDKTYRKKYNLNSAQQSRKYFLRLKAKEYDKMLSRKREIHGDDAPNYKSYQAIAKKRRNAKDKIADIEDNQRHQMAADIDRKFDVFVVEALNSKDMLESMPNHDTSRKMAETGFGKTLSVLQRKMGARLITVDPRNTSRTDSFCGHVHKNNRNGEKFRCKSCGRTANADYNASINILAAGIVAEPTKFRFKVVSKSGST